MTFIGFCGRPPFTVKSISLYKSFTLALLGAVVFDTPDGICGGVGAATGGVGKIGFGIFFLFNERDFINCGSGVGSFTDEVREGVVDGDLGVDGNIKSSRLNPSSLGYLPVNIP